MTEPLVRHAEAHDLAAIGDIYGYHVRYGTGTFEIEPPSADELVARWQRVVAHRLPFLVATLDERVAGFGYCNRYRDRPAYRLTVEDSVYVDEQERGRGLGRALLERLIAECERQGYRQMVAVVGDSANAASIAAHRRVGFLETGVLRAVGFKHGRWLDTVLLQRGLGPADTERP
jgi:phosphinothricin acetyltransferase